MQGPCSARPGLQTPGSAGVLPRPQGTETVTVLTGRTQESTLPWWGSRPLKPTGTPPTEEAAEGQRGHASGAACSLRGRALPVPSPLAEETEPTLYWEALFLWLQPPPLQDSVGSKLPYRSGARSRGSRPRRAFKGLNVKPRGRAAPRAAAPATAVTAPAFQPVLRFCVQVSQFCVSQASL